MKGWLDEKTREKIKVFRGDYKKELLKFVTEDQLPEFLGGTNTASLGTDPGPWNDYEIVEGVNKGDIVGIRKISDGDQAPIFTMLDFESLPNPLLNDPQKSVEHFNQHKRGEL